MSILPQNRKYLPSADSLSPSTSARSCRWANDCTKPVKNGIVDAPASATVITWSHLTSGGRASSANCSANLSANSPRKPKRPGVGVTSLWTGESRRLAASRSANAVSVILVMRALHTDCANPRARWRHGCNRRAECMTGSNLHSRACGVPEASGGCPESQYPCGSPRCSPGRPRRRGTAAGCRGACPFPYSATAFVRFATASHASGGRLVQRETGAKT